LICPKWAFGTKEKGMLILTRNVNEKIMVGDDVEITVLSVTGGQVRLGVEAPKDVPVHREEIYQQIKQKQGSRSTL